MDDRLFVDGRILTPEHRAEALLIESGRVVAVGPSSDLRRQKATGTAVTPLHGRLIVPGIVDAHMHLADSIWARWGVSVAGSPSIPSLRNRLERYARRRPKGPFVGGGWDETRWRGHRLPTAHDLESRSIDQPALLYRVCTHVAVLNEAALSELGIDRGTPDPPGGRIGRTPRGEPNGLLFENAERLALPLVERFLLQNQGRVGEFLLSAASLGLTAMAPMNVEPYEIQVLARRSAGRPFPVRLAPYLSLRARKQFRRLRRQLTHPDVRLAGLKAVLDGALGPRTAWLQRPYRDDPSTSGQALWSEATIRAAAREDGVRALPLALHAIGDRALALGIRILTERGGRLRDRIEHASLVPPRLLGRLAATGARVVVQPRFLSSDVWIQERLGARRARWAYPFRSLRAAGIVLAGSSDAPVESLDPWAAMRVAVERAPRSAFGRSTASEALTAEQALWMYTRGGAEACGEDRLGRLAPGGVADFVVMDAPDLPVALTAGASSVLATWKGGVQTFARRRRKAGRSR
jgi:predicted amidohydrolase YtcJ